MLKEQIVSKKLNEDILDKNFIDKNIFEYLYASLTQPPIKIIDKCGSDDELEFIVECPNCKSHINYGDHIFMLAGHLYCDTKGCREKLLKENEYLARKYGV